MVFFCFFFQPPSSVLPLNLTTSQQRWTQPSLNKAQRPAFILLLNCEDLLTPPPSPSLSLNAEGWRGLFFFFGCQSALRDARDQRGFVGYLFAVATTPTITTTTTTTLLTLADFCPF